MSEMDSERRELFRKAILRVLEANNTRFGLTVPAIRHMLGMFGFPVMQADSIEDEIGYLEGKGLVEEVLKVISRENRAWRLSQQGLALLDRGA